MILPIVATGILQIHRLTVPSRSAAGFPETGGPPATSYQAPHHQSIDQVRFVNATTITAYAYKAEIGEGTDRFNAICKYDH